MLLYPREIFGGGFVTYWHTELRLLPRPPLSPQKNARTARRSRRRVNREIVPPHLRDARPPHRSPSLGFPMGWFPMKLALHRSPRMDVPGAADIAVHTTAIATRQLGLTAYSPAKFFRGGM